MRHLIHVSATEGMETNDKYFRVEAASKREAVEKYIAKAIDGDNETGLLDELKASIELAGNTYMIGRLGEAVDFIDEDELELIS